LGIRARHINTAGHWNQIAAAALGGLGSHTIEGTARIFALLNIALADAGIACWDAKYVYNYWRPITAIQGAAEDGNPNTAPDPLWTPFLETPPFPEYPSGHSAFSGAAAAVLANVFGTDSMSFSVGSDDIPNYHRFYTSFSQAAQESGISRILGGIHFSSANVYGLSMGAAVGNWLVSRVMTPVEPLTGTGESILATAIKLEPAILKAGTPFTATVTGIGLSDGTFFDVRFRAPGDITDREALNWQKGISITHETSSTVVDGMWTITAVRAHRIESDHTGYIPVSIGLLVTPGS
jgi:membrane-associated phospholipid phosphatase